MVRLACRLLPVVVLASALTSGVEAASLKDSDSFDAASHAAACKCGAKCRGASCCCGSRKPTRPASKATDPAPRIAPTFPASDNPCVNSAPCGDPTLPPSAPVGSESKVAAPGRIEVPAPPSVGHLVLAPSSRLPSDRRPSRLDRPPKALA